MINYLSKNIRFEKPIDKSCRQNEIHSKLNSFTSKNPQILDELQRLYLDVLSLPYSSKFTFKNVKTLVYLTIYALVGKDSIISVHLEFMY